jgi:GNAT superfamily N-acetyltransferase
LASAATSDAADWAQRGGIPRVERAIMEDEVWVAILGSRIAGWLHLAANSIEGLYISPATAQQGVGTALMKFVENHILEMGHRTVILETSQNAVDFYLRLGYAVASVQRSAVALTMHKQIVTTQS